MNILTFDIEDWWVYDHYNLGNEKDYLLRLDRYLNEILDLLDAKKIKATFFCLGEVAKNYPEIIKRIVLKGHHIGCHSFSHKFWGDANYAEVAEDTYKAINTLENIIGEKVTAYRAPAFSITTQNKWIFGILAQNGITQDCSIFPANRSYGGFPGFKSKTPILINYQGIKIKEFPMSTTTILGNEIGFSGGGYFRLFPYWIIKKLIKKNDYVMTYFHIKDFDKEQVRNYKSFQGESAVSRYLKNYYGLDNNFEKFFKLIRCFNFVSVNDADKNIKWDTKPSLNL